MMRFDERYDEFGYEREDADYEEQINEFLTPREVMELLAIGKNTFYKMVQSGQLPAFRGLSQILCKHRNAVQIEQNLFKAEVAQAAAALFSK